MDKNNYKSSFSIQLDNILSKYWKDVGKGIEVEIRLGKISKNMFVSGVGHSFFQGMKNYLSSKKVWVNPKEQVSYDIIYKNGERVTLVAENGRIRQGEVVKNQKYESFDFNFSGSPYG